MSHNPYVLFLCTLNISVLSLRIFISFLSNMAIQSSSEIGPKGMSDALCNASKTCGFFAWLLKLLDSGRILVSVAFIVVLFGNLTVGPLWVSFMVVRATMSSILH